MAGVAVHEKEGVVRVKIVLELPDETRCLNVCAVYETGCGGMAMAATMRGTAELHDGAVCRIPNKDEGEEE